MAGNDSDWGRLVFRCGRRGRGPPPWISKCGRRSFDAHGGAPICTTPGGGRQGRSPKKVRPASNSVQSAKSPGCRFDRSRLDSGPAPEGSSGSRWLSLPYSACAVVTDRVDVPASRGEANPLSIKNPMRDLVIFVDCCASLDGIVVRCQSTAEVARKQARCPPSPALARSLTCPVLFGLDDELVDPTSVMLTDPGTSYPR